MRTLTLSDGTSYEVDWCNADKGILLINLVTDASFIELATKFGNRQLTNEMHAKFDEDHEATYIGYTELKAIQVDMWQTGTTLITLNMPEKSLAA